MDAGSNSTRYAAPDLRGLLRVQPGLVPALDHGRRRLMAAKAVRYGGAGLLVAAAIALLNRAWLGAVNPWILVTAPLNPWHQENFVIGYSWLLEGVPLHKENLPALFQSLSFNGILTPPSGYFLRPLYPFLTSLASWSVGLEPAALLVNHIAYGVLVVSTAWLAYRLSRSTAAAVTAATLAAVGSGSILHLNDLSAHMLGYAMYALLTCVLFASDVWRTQRPFATHLGLSAGLALASLAYPSGFLLTFGYVLVAVRTSRLHHVLVAFAIAFSARFLWEYVLNFGYTAFFHVGPYDLYSIDFGTAKRVSIEYWLYLLKGDPYSLLIAIGSPLFDSIFTAFPALTLAGIASVLLVNRRTPSRLWFFVVFAALPYCGVVFFSPGAGARGYLVYCSAFVLFAATAAVGFTGRGGAPLRRLVPPAVVLALVACQAAWSVAHLFGYYFPAVAFYIGYFHGIDPFAAIDVVNLSDSAPLWRFYGGPAGFAAAGGLPLGSIATDGQYSRSFGFSLLTNGFIISFFILGAAVLLHRPAHWASPRPVRSRGILPRIPPARPGRQVWSWLALWLLAASSVSGLGYKLQRQAVRHFSPDQTSRLPGEQTVTATIDLSPEARSKFREKLVARPDLEVQLFMRGTGLVDSRVTLGGEDVGAKPVPISPGTFLWQLDGRAVADALSSGRSSLSVRALLRDGTLGGWQRAPAAGREVLPALTVESSGYFPSLELRLLDRARNTVVLIGY